ncbi:SGNH/GDSL hydrolase family protein [Jannaschia sp. Os4]|uniref:SGNH/GDSL hydrolase family protein n=1 Tax=Jannaschia sp. Os4 TaxID=2807617 RepID=UPI00193A3525|nr:SGNH/GDSL hydrolase family protein [Jannaschia sp. Os4]MBM2575119.1 SGNH/GDSL hydrolase family protein [Jannaschia sp. Os4]
MRGVAVALLLTACASTGGGSAGGGLLAVGDSVLAWNGAAGVPEGVGAALGLPVRDASRSGARVASRGSGITAFVPSVSEQWRANAGRWDWVLMDGGANDLQGACGTAAERAVLDRLISPALTGAIPSLVAEMRATGSRVALMGYYPGLAGRVTSFTGCTPVLTELDRRLARLAARDAGIVFADSGDVIRPAVRADYAADAVHPSAQGSARIAGVMAGAMR